MMPQNSSEYFCNRTCEYFPCHLNADPKHFNCLFCYCPLYALGPRCGGDYRYLDNGIKDCSNCLIPHSEPGYRYILEKFPLIAELANQE